MKVDVKRSTPQPSTSPGASTSTTQGDAPPKKKQKRNKPTLSCEECVERKTKVRREQKRRSVPARPDKHSTADRTRSVTAQDPIAWPASNGNPRASTLRSPI